MYFKFSILLLSYIVAASTELKDIKDEVMVYIGYNFALSHYNSVGRGLSACDMTQYVGLNNLKSIRDYLTLNEVPANALDNIDLKLFENFVRAICKDHEYDIKDFIIRRAVVAANP